MLTRPTGTDIRAARQAAGLTQTAAGRLVHAALRTWQQWEAGDAAMPLASWELFRIKARKLERKRGIPAAAAPAENPTP